MKIKYLIALIAVGGFSLEPKTEARRQQPPAAQHTLLHYSWYSARPAHRSYDGLDESLGEHPGLERSRR